MNSKTNTVRAILLDASECDRPEADHPATIEICADDLQRILERHITEPAQCLLQIAEPATAGTAVRAFRDYLGVHDGIKLGGHAMDDMALDLARIALNFPEALKGVRSEKPEPAAPQAVQPVVPLPLLVRDIARDLGITVPEACIALKPLGNYSTNSAVTAEMARMLRAHLRAGPAHPAEGVPSHAVAGNDLIRAAKQALACMDGLQQHLGRAVCQIEADELRTAHAATQPAAKGMLSDADYDDLWRFEGMASDGEGYDISKERMKRLAELGVIRWCGGSRYAVTSFGLYVLKAWQRLPLETYVESYARCNAEFKARIERLNAEALAAQAKQGVLTMAKNSKPVDAQGWCRPNPDGPEHYFTDAYPACGWQIPVKTNESGRCIKCERAVQAAKQGEQQ